MAKKAVKVATEEVVVEKNYEDYVKKLADIEKAESEAKEAKDKLNEEYKEIVETHKTELEQAFTMEQDKYGRTLAGKYYYYERTFAEKKGYIVKALFRLDKYRQFTKNQGPVPVIYVFEGFETTMIADGNNILRLDCHKCADKDCKEGIMFAISNSEFDSTKEITKEEYEQKIEEFRTAFYV